MRFRALMFLVVLLCGACITPVQPRPTSPANNLTTETSAAKLENVAEIVPGAIGPDTFAPNVNPLTGLPVTDPAALNRRPMVVKISNAPPIVRPQAGISAADLVFEHYAEGGLTRFSAVYYSQLPSRVGSIRSARLIDYELVPMYQAFLVFSGASAGIEDRLNRSEFADRLFKGVALGPPYYWRDDTIDVPHNLFANLAELSRLGDSLNQRPNLHGLAFLPAPPPGSSGPAASIDLRYRATRLLWLYDPAMGLYRRFADGEGHFDATTLQQITAANVVIVYADHQFTDIVESQFQDSVSYSIEIKLWFEGRAILFRDGQRYDGRWWRPTRQDMLALRTDDNQFLYLKPGSTWFQVVRLPEQQEPAEEWLTVE